MEDCQWPACGCSRRSQCVDSQIERLAVWLWRQETALSSARWDEADQEHFRNHARAAWEAANGSGWSTAMASDALDCAREELGQVYISHHDVKVEEELLAARYHIDRARCIVRGKDPAIVQRSPVLP